MAVPKNVTTQPRAPYTSSGFLNPPGPPNEIVSEFGLRNNPVLQQWLGGNDAAAVNALVARLGGSQLGSLEERLKWFAADKAAFEASTDPAIHGMSSSGGLKRGGGGSGSSSLALTFVVG